MKFTDGVIGIFLAGLCSFVVCGGFKTYIFLEKKVSELRYEISSKKFVSESFRNTCNGKGFSDLNEWQVTCREMFQLDYIGWSNANEFMTVSKDNSERELYFGTWKKGDEYLKVYSRMYRENQ